MIALPECRCRNSASKRPSRSRSSLRPRSRIETLRRKLADPTIEPGFLFRFADAVWERQARALLDAFVGGDVAELHDDFLFAFVRALNALMEDRPAGE